MRVVAVTLSKARRHVRHDQHQNWNWHMHYSHWRWGRSQTQSQMQRDVQGGLKKARESERKGAQIQEIEPN